MKPLRPNPSHFVTFSFSFSWCGERETFSDLRGRRFSRVCFSKLRSTCWSKSLLHNFDLSCEVFGSIIQVHVKMYLFDLLIEKIADLLFSRACHFKNSQDNCFQISCTCSPYQKSEMMQLSNAYLISTRRTKNQLTKFGVYLGCFDLSIPETWPLYLSSISILTKYRYTPSITDGVHRTENFVEIIPVFSTFSNFFKKKNKKL